MDVPGGLPAFTLTASINADAKLFYAGTWAGPVALVRKTGQCPLCCSPFFARPQRSDRRLSITSPASPDPDKPGKIRTWWHPLLAGFLRWQLGSHYDVREEVPVGKKPLQIDFLLLHETQGELSDHARTLLAGLTEYLNEYTLVELKSPSDTLRARDFRTLLAYALLYCSQQQETIEPARMTLIVIGRKKVSGPFSESHCLEKGPDTFRGLDALSDNMRSLAVALLARDIADC